MALPLRTENMDSESLICTEVQEQLNSKAPLGLRYRVALAGFGVATMLAGAVALKAGQKPMLATPVGIVGLDEVPDNCFKSGMFYANPYKMPDSEKTTEADAKACQARCMANEDCAHFSFWPDGGCLLTAAGSYLKAAGFTYSGVIVGPKSCDELHEYETFIGPNTTYCTSDVINEGPSAGAVACQMRCDTEKNCKFFSLWATGGENWCRTSSSCTETGDQWHHSITIFKQKVVPPPVETPVPVVGLPGINGTSCSAYPACVSVSITEGDCCPNAEGVSLGCCNGFPPPVQVVTIAAGTECTAFPGCLAANLTEGGCCPTPTGVRLGCCDAV
eukprot:TRINITY_DN79691_c0_g1_i1.p1 TRINITY_DN79691_c0_g1~~TRINITY_DN79691_c0_g1_i1.p1  ORF type:complete len:332 (+),score=67.44 TRINITY_DN79691_c0_g1_i1:113-1108(+)